MNTRQTGLLVAAAGLLIVLVGLAIAAGGLSWFGRLPGDLRVERGNVRIYFPVTTMVLLSIALGIVAWLVRRLS